MNRTRRIRTSLTALLLTAAACGVQDAAETATPAAEAVDSATTANAGPADSGYVPLEEAEPQPRVRLYPTLTDYEWYARGEPLRHEGVAYLPSGAPVTAATSDMQHAGEYQSVDYYVRAGVADGVVYVPVYRGYWQPFRAGSSSRADSSSQ